MTRASKKKGKVPINSGGGKFGSGGGGGGGGGAAAATSPTEKATGSLLSPELMAELGGDGITNAGGAVAVAARRSKGKKRERGGGASGGDKVSNEIRVLAATISKSKAKKLKQLEDKKVKDGRRAELYLKLESNRLSQQQLSLLQSSKTISQNQDTLRSRVKHAVQRAVAGIALDDAAVAELETHPQVVADVEEALSLPVGGAMAAATRKTAATAVGKGGGGRGGVVNAGRGGGGGRAASAVTAVARGKTPAGVGAEVFSSRKRSRSTALARAPRPVQVSTARSERGGDGSSGDVSDSSSMDSSSSESEGEGESEHKRGGKATRKTTAAATVAAAAAGTAAPESRAEGHNNGGASAPETAKSALKGRESGITAEEGGAVGGEGAADPISGSSWAAKMMSSLARVPTSAGGGASFSTRTKPAAALPAKEGSGNEPSASAMDDSDGEEKSAAAVEGGAETEALEDKEAVASYPPPPSWLETNAPVYHAVETPLPSVSGDSGVGSGKGPAGGSGARLPRPERWIPVVRPVELQAARMELPICGMEQEIMEAIHDNDAVILCGETGSGKSTQVPQFLYEAGYAAHGLIGVTQPRRVAAVGTAERVAVELGTKCGRGGAVAYQIRYDASGVGKKTRVKFMTDGVLLQEITSDLLLRKYSAVLLDEAHERNLNTDVLLGMLSRSIPLRRQVAEEEQRSWDMLSEDRKKEVKPPLRPLKLVIMSATLRVTDFTENTALFPTPPPVISATSRQHPVTVHFSKQTELYDYLGETFKKVCKVHQRLPEGGVLVFLTGKREIVHMCDKLRREFPPPRAKTGRGGKGSRGRRLEEEKEGGGGGGGVDDELTGNTRSEQKNMDTSEDQDQDQKEEEEDGSGGGDGVQEVSEGKERAGRGRLPVPEEACGEGGAEATAAEVKKPPQEKPRETDRDALLYREADDDEEDAARLADMERDNDSVTDIAGAGDNDGGKERRNSDHDGRGGEGGLSSGSEAEDDGDRGGGVSEGGGESRIGGGGGSGNALPPVHVVPLYAMLTAEEQAKVFRAPPEGHRLIVVATNVAETSITIPGISYVVDCGRQKRRVVQRGSGISQFEVGWVSKASADQRAGRAGRTGPGHCYRLYSSAVYTQTLEAFAAPEVLTRPLEDVMLQMKAMGVVDVSRFPFPTPPDATGLRSAATLLANLGATAGRGNIDGEGSGGGGGGAGMGDGTGEITPVGKALALLPVGARYAKMLLLAVQGGLLDHATALVAMLTEGDPFVRPSSAVKTDGNGESATGAGGREEERGGRGAQGEGGEVDAEEVRRKRAQWLHPSSDALARLKAAGAYSYATSGGTVTGGGDFCRENFLHGPTMERSQQLRRQLTRLVDLRFGTEPGWKGCSENAQALRPPNRRQSAALRQVLLSGLLDNVARRAPAGTVKAGTKLQRDCAYLSSNEAITEPLYIKSTSVLFSRDPQELPEWVVYQDIVRGEREGAPANMTCVSAIEAAWLPSLAEGSPLLSFSQPLVSPAPTYDASRHAVVCRVTPSYGVHAWELPPYPTELASVAPANRPDMVFRWFGRLLLEGGVVDGCLSELKAKEMLNDPPSLVTRERPAKKVAILVLELRQKGVCSLPALVQQWRRDRTYLKGPVELWVKLGSRQEFEKVWANAIKKAVLALAASGGGVGGGSTVAAAADAQADEAERRQKKARA